MFAVFPKKTWKPQNFYQRESPHKLFMIKNLMYGLRFIFALFNNDVDTAESLSKHLYRNFSIRWTGDMFQINNDCTKKTLMQRRRHKNGVSLILNFSFFFVDFGKRFAQFTQSYINSSVLEVVCFYYVIFSTVKLVTRGLKKLFFIGQKRCVNDIQLMAWHVFSACVLAITLFPIC